MLDLAVTSLIARDLSARQFADAPPHRARRRPRRSRPAPPSAAAPCASCARSPIASSPPRAAPRSPERRRAPCRVRSVAWRTGRSTSSSSAGASPRRPPPHTLREQGFDGSILLVGREPHPPYHRPPASKEYLRGEHGPDGAHVHPADWWDAQRRRAADAHERARPRHRGAHRQALHQGGGRLRPRADRDRRDGPPPGRRRRPARGRALPARARQRRHASARTSEGAERVVCVGGSYIASEVAASLTELGKQRDDGHARGPSARARLRHHRRALLPRACSRSTASRSSAATRSPASRATSASSASSPQGGRELAAQAVICGVGAIPDVMLARKAGLALGELGGVLCDSRLRTSAERIYAAGDMCEYDSRRPRPRDAHRARGGRRRPGRHRRAQHARRRRRRTTRSPTSSPTSSDWASLEYLGPALSWDDEQVEGSRRRRRVRDLVPRGRPACAAMLSVGGAGDLDRARELIRG